MGTHLYSLDFSDTVRKKIIFFAFLVIFCFLCLWLRVWYLQVLKGSDFMGLSENNRVRMISLPSYRGEITDRNGVTLASIRPSFNLYITPEDVQDLGETLSTLKEKIDFDISRVKHDIRESQPFSDVLIKADITRDHVAFVEENNRLLSGIHLKVEPLRNYHYKDLAAHVFGYLGEINKEELRDGFGYKLGDMVGKEGVEFLFEEEMKGKKGYKEVEVDVSGRELTVLRKKPAQSGNHMVLTLDLRIQKVVEQLMTGTEEKPISGAAVVMKVQTGEILAMTSQPSFDPNMFSSGISVREWRKLILNNEHPLHNKAIEGQYPPGSIYKIVAAYAALEEQAITPDTTVFCPGYYRLGRRNYRCWNRGGHGTVNLHDALVQSCDVYFYTIGHRMGIDTLARYAKKLGLGSLTKINLIGEKPGLVPTKDWKLKARGQEWLAGETISASIGQGFNLVTPLQQVRMMATVANGGMSLQPYLVREIRDKDGRVVRDIFPKIMEKLESRPETLSLIRSGLFGVVNEKKGTGWRARLKNIEVAGKTGTAQVVRLRIAGHTVEEETLYKHRDHAWFVGYAPYENPEIAVAVIIEHGGHGGVAAAPIARKIIETYNSYYPMAPPKEKPPATRKKRPATKAPPQEESPVVEEESPATQEETPVAEEENFETQEESPATQEETPAAEEENFETQEESPATQEENFGTQDADI